MKINWKAVISWTGMVSNAISIGRFLLGMGLAVASMKWDEVVHFFKGN